VKCTLKNAEVQFRFELEDVEPIQKLNGSTMFRPITAEATVYQPVRGGIADRWKVLTVKVFGPLCCKDGSDGAINISSTYYGSYFDRGDFPDWVEKIAVTALSRAKMLDIELPAPDETGNYAAASPGWPSVTSVKVNRDFLSEPRVALSTDMMCITYTADRSREIGAAFFAAADELDNEKAAQK
jgi:hypothetical protein